MTLTSSIILFAIMAALAALPSSSVLLVVAQSAARGVKNGVATALGVVTGDLVFMSMAILGMTALAEQLGTLFVLVKYLAGAYLIWFGINLVRAGRVDRTDSVPETPKATGSTLFTSFASGLLLTLGDLKAIFFYASLLPTFIDLSRLSTADVAVISLITIVAVGGVKSIYAIGAHRATAVASRFKFARKLKLASGGLMISAGAYVLLKD